MIQLNISSLNKESVYLYKLFIKKIFEKGSISYSMIDIPTRRKRITLLKSPHVNKTAREQFEFRSYKTAVFVNNSLAVENLKYIILNKPKTTRITLKKIGG